MEDNELTARIAFTEVVLRALIASHPRPDALQTAFTEEAGALLTSRGITEVGVTSRHLADVYQRLYWQWSSDFAEALPARG